MGLSFRKRVRIAPGLYLNVSSGGTSWTVGVPGATLNFGEREELEQQLVFQVLAFHTAIKSVEKKRVLRMTRSPQLCFLNPNILLLPFLNIPTFQ
ncbi:DUF4236 domain-containing protein [Pantoea vagans]|uniref:DUF4236 domain-containing protein n=1 Tax=Pantoea vagans TaxID=470934 RepID=UPI00301777D7